MSCRFLRSYLESLVGIKLNSNIDPCKRKMILRYDVSTKPSCGIPFSEVAPGGYPPKHGRVKLNSDGSYVMDGEAGAGMILQIEVEAIIFSTCRTLYFCLDAPEAELRLYGRTLHCYRKE